MNTRTVHTVCIIQHTKDMYSIRIVLYTCAL
jgi:hypothetical protein